MIAADIAALDWRRIGAELDAEGCCVLPRLLSDDQVRALRAACDELRPAPPVDSAAEASDGAAWIVSAPMPSPLDDLLPALYRPLLDIDRLWRFRMDTPAPGLADLQAFAEPAPARAPELRVARLATGERTPLRRDELGEHGFLLELEMLLSTPGSDFTGGEFVLTEQRPRMQSRPLVPPLRCGDALIYAADRRPVDGTHGPYRVRLKHAVSPVRAGQRLGATIVFRPGDGATGHA